MTADKLGTRGWIAAIDQETKRLLPLLREVRRYLHQHPELSMQEFQTTEYLARKLSEEGIEGRKTSARVGLVCDVEFAIPTASIRRIGIRGDIDALPLRTNIVEDYASANPNAMHACGHDVHATMALGATILIQRMAIKRLLPWPVSLRTIFQPAEETSQGGPLVIQEGWVDGLSAALALHVDPTLVAGSVSTRAGIVTAGCTSFSVSIVGSSGHSARPHLAADALAAGMQFVQQSYAMVPRSYDCREAAVVHFGTFQSGTAANIVSDTSILTGTLRTFENAVREIVLDRMRDIAQSIAQLYRCSVDIEIHKTTPALRNDPILALKLLSFCNELPMVEESIELSRPSMGAEDFAFIAERIPACLLRIGTAGRDGQSMRHPLHSSYFDVDESVLGVGTQILAAAAINECCPADEPTRRHAF